MADVGQEALLGLSDLGPFLGPVQGPLGFHLSGDVALAQEHAGLARGGIDDQAYVDEVRARADQGEHLPQFGHHLAVDDRSEGRLALIAILEAVREAAVVAVGGESGRVGEDRGARGVEQGDGARGVAQRLHRPQFAPLDLRRRRLEQQGGPAILQLQRGDHRLHRHRPALGIEGPALADRLTVGGDLGEALHPAADGEGEPGKVALEQFLQVGGAPELQRRAVGVQPPARRRIEQPDGPPQAVPSVHACRQARVCCRRVQDRGPGARDLPLPSHHLQISNGWNAARPRRSQKGGAAGATGGGDGRRSPYGSPSP